MLNHNLEVYPNLSDRPFWERGCGQEVKKDRAFFGGSYPIELQPEFSENTFFLELHWELQVELTIFKPPF